MNGSRVSVTTRFGWRRMALASASRPSSASSTRQPHCVSEWRYRLRVSMSRSTNRTSGTGGASRSGDTAAIDTYSWRDFTDDIDQYVRCIRREQRNSCLSCTALRRGHVAATKGIISRRLRTDFGRELPKEIVGELTRGGVNEARSDRGDEAANLHLRGARDARPRRVGRQADGCGPSNKTRRPFAVEDDRERLGRTLVAQFRLP